MRGPITTAVVAAATLMLVAGCASAAPVVALDPAPADVPDVSTPVETLTTVLTELSAHFLDASDTPAAIVSDGATVAVAVEELAQALPLGVGAREFATATAFELSRSALDEDVTSVDVTADQPRVVGSHGGLPVATVEITEHTARDGGPTTEVSVTYAIVLDGDVLDDVLAWSDGLDSGVGLDSPTGAVLRFLQLVQAGDIDAARFFSGDVNTDTQLRVLHSLLAGRAGLVELPQFQMGSARLVYALDADGRVIGRFEVLLGGTTSVVYSPTS